MLRSTNFDCFTTTLRVFWLFKVILENIRKSGRQRSEIIGTSSEVFGNPSQMKTKTLLIFDSGNVNGNCA